jgi:hypothetical protein
MFRYGMSFLIMTLLDIKNGKFVPTSLNANPHMQKNLTNPIIPPIRIKENENITGQIVFVITDSTEYQLNLTDIDTKVVSSQYINFENSTPTRNPVSLTINSARKMARVNQDGMHVRDGTISSILMLHS